MPRKSLKFLHLADLHLDRVPTGGKLRLPYEKAQKRRRDGLDALNAAVELARREEVEVILIAGDLWEEDGLSAETVVNVIDTLGRAGAPVVIAPGNHDYYSTSSHYSSDILEARFGRSWPPNVHIFREYDFYCMTLPELEGVSFTGIAYRSNQPVELRLLRDQLEVAEGADINICVMHGSREAGLPRGKTKTLPFSDEELLAQPFDYTALGHYHARAEIKDESGRIRAAYPGSTCWLLPDETGPRGALLGVVRKGGVDENDLAFHNLDPRRLHRLSFDVTGLARVQDVEEHILALLTKDSMRRDDAALVELTGVFPEGSRMSFDEKLLESYYHLQIDPSAVLPEWDIDGDVADPSTTEGRFRAVLKERIQEAAQRGNIEEAQRLQNAMFYGLDALHDRTVSPRSAG